MFVNCVWELDALGTGVFWLLLKTIFLNMAPENFLLNLALYLTAFPISELLNSYITSPKKIFKLKYKEIDCRYLPKNLL